MTESPWVRLEQFAQDGLQVAAVAFAVVWTARKLAPRLVSPAAVQLTGGGLAVSVVTYAAIWAGHQVAERI